MADNINPRATDLLKPAPQPESSQTLQWAQERAKLVERYADSARMHKEEGKAAPYELKALARIEELDELITAADKRDRITAMQKQEREDFGADAALARGEFTSDEMLWIEGIRDRGVQQNAARAFIAKHFRPGTQDYDAYTNATHPDNRRVTREVANAFRLAGLPN